MKPLVLTLREAPPQRLDLSGLVPHKLAKMTAAEIARIAIATTREPLAAGDIFTIRMGDPLAIRIEGGSERFDEVGHGLAEGEIVVDGDVGLRAGRFMTGGRLVITGHAGPWAASGLKGGTFEIGGSVGERLGGPVPGEVAGMRGGLVIVRGDAGGTRRRPAAARHHRDRRACRGLCGQPHDRRHPHGRPQRRPPARLSDAPRHAVGRHAAGGAFAHLSWTAAFTTSWRTGCWPPMCGPTVGYSTVCSRPPCVASPATWRSWARVNCSARRHETAPSCRR